MFARIRVFKEPHSSGIKGLHMVYTKESLCETVRLEWSDLELSENISEESHQNVEVLASSVSNEIVLIATHF